MLNIDTAAVNGQPAANAPRADKGSFSDGSDFAMFLRMLTTQMQNQNPLNPVEASDFAVQLATFSGVEQQIQTNQLLGRLADQMMFSDLANWLNKEVATDAPVTYSGAPLRLHAPAISGATSRDLVISTIEGRELTRVAASTGQNSHVFDPAQDLPDSLPHGQYIFTIEDFRGNDTISSIKAVQYSPVTEVRNNNGQVVLVLEGGQQVTSAQISAIR